MQQFLMLTYLDVAPIPKASKFVKEVIVMDIPLFLNIIIILSSTEISRRDGASAIPDIKRNMSSIPIPEMYALLIKLFCMKFIIRYRVSFSVLLQL